MPLEELRPRRPEDEQGARLGAVGEVLEEREHRLVGPVEVLEDEDGRALVGDVLEEPAPGRELLVALGRRAGLDPEQREEPLRGTTLARLALGQDLVELGGRRTPGVRLEDPGVGLDDLAERPERDPSPYGRQRPWRHVTSSGIEST